VVCSLRLHGGRGGPPGNSPGSSISCAAAPHPVIWSSTSSLLQRSWSHHRATSRSRHGSANVRAVSQNLAQRLEGWERLPLDQLEPVDAWNRGDFETWIESFSTHCEWHPFSMTQVEGEGGVYTGHHQLRAFVQEVKETWERFQITVHEAHQHDNLRLIRGTISARGRASGAEGSTEVYLLVVVGDENKTEWVKVFPELDQALEAVSEREGDLR
jgi:hypothetical protein